MHGTIDILNHLGKECEISHHRKLEFIYEPYKIGRLIYKRDLFEKACTLEQTPRHSFGIIFPSLRYYVAKIIFF